MATRRLLLEDGSSACFRSGFQSGVHQHHHLLLVGGFLQLLSFRSDSRNHRFYLLNLLLQMFTLFIYMHCEAVPAHSCCCCCPAATASSHHINKHQEMCSSKLHPGVFTPHPSCCSLISSQKRMFHPSKDLRTYFLEPYAPCFITVSRLMNRCLFHGAPLSSILLHLI